MCFESALKRSDANSTEFTRTYGRLVSKLPSIFLVLLTELNLQFEMPLWVWRLPNDVGYPAGGSLSADEYKALITVYCPIIVCDFWAIKPRHCTLTFKLGSADLEGISTAGSA